VLPNICWRALARQQPITRKSQNLLDIRSETCAVYCVFYIRGVFECTWRHAQSIAFFISGVLVNARGFRAKAVYSLTALLEIKDTINELSF